MCAAKCVAAAAAAAAASAEVEVEVSSAVGEDEDEDEDEDGGGAGATPHMNVNVPLSAPFVPPDTGASKKYGRPVVVDATAAAMARDVAGSIVLQSTYVFLVACESDEDEVD